jgi:hypothetical protein
MEYPKKFDICPNCGSMNRVIESEVKQEESKGNLRVGTKAACIIVNTPIFDPTKTDIIAPRKIPVITALIDICSDCGTLYCVEVNKDEGTAHPEVRRDDHKQYPM